MNSLIVSILILSVAVVIQGATFATETKAGSCPALIPGMAGTCVMGCFGDESCPGDKKCCSNGCGYVCKDPVTVDTNPIQLEGSTTSGSCPDTSGIITICVITPLNCFSDDQCANGSKCCPYGCGSICLKTVD